MTTSNLDDLNLMGRQGEAAAGAELALHLGGARHIDKEHLGLVLPEGKRIESLQAIIAEREAWELRGIKGHARLARLESFIAHVKHFQRPETAVFADDSTLSAVFDYHHEFRVAEATDEQQAQRCAHRATYAFPLSEEWQAWARAWGKPLSPRELSELLEDRLDDILDPTAAPDSVKDAAKRLGLKLGDHSELVQVARELKVSAKREVAAAHTLATGEHTVEFSETHSAARSGGKSISVPTGFAIGIPVLEGGAGYPLLVRLRYALQDAAVTWTLVPLRPERVRKDAIEGEVARFREECGDVPFFYGSPER